MTTAPSTRCHLDPNLPSPLENLPQGNGVARGPSCFTSRVRVPGIEVTGRIPLAGLQTLQGFRHILVQNHAVLTYRFNISHAP